MINTLPKPPAIAFLAVSIFISRFNIDFVGAQNASADPDMRRYRKKMKTGAWIRLIEH